MSLKEQIFQNYLVKLEEEDIIPSELVSGLSEIWSNSEGITKERIFVLLEASVDD